MPEQPRAGPILAPYMEPLPLYFFLRLERRVAGGGGRQFASRKQITQLQKSATAGARIPAVAAIPQTYFRE